MFDDLENSIMSKMNNYKDTKWEWHSVHDVIDAYNRERAVKDSSCAVENSVDESVDSFFAVILNEIEMAQNKLKVI